MVIIISSEGRFGNKLLQAAHFLSSAKEHGYRVVHRDFDEYQEYFSESIKALPAFFRFSGGKVFFRILNKLLLKLNHVFGIKHISLPFFEIFLCREYYQDSRPFDIGTQSFIQKARSKIVLVSGWPFRDIPAFQKNRVLVQTLLRPNVKYLVEANQYVTEIRKNHDVLIGIHIRRGDYRNFYNGIWYYSDDQYMRVMNKILAFPELSGKRICFLICSDEKIEKQNFTGLPVFIHSRHFMYDFCTLASCDYIAGPNSTFTIWAAYFANKPLLMLHTADMEFGLPDFLIP